MARSPAARRGKTNRRLQPIVPPSNRCHWRSSAGEWARCHGLCETERWFHDRRDVEIACAIRVAELLQSPTLSGERRRRAASRLEAWPSVTLPSRLSHQDALRADELGLQVRLAFFEEHRDHVREFAPQLL